MATTTTILERERLLQIAEEYRSKGYEVSFRPNLDDLPDFLRNYRPDMIVRRADENVIVEVKSRSSLNSSSGEHLQNLAKYVEQHPGWRLELVITNPEEAEYSPQAESSFQKSEIETRLQVARQLAAQYPESAILYSWSLVEATLRLVAEHDGISLQRLDPLYLVKQLVTEGAISHPEYQLLMNAISLRNTIAHGFKTAQTAPELTYQLISVAEGLLKTLDNNDRVH